MPTEQQLAERVVELEALVRSQAERIAAQSEMLARTAELRAVLAPVAAFVGRVKSDVSDGVPVALGVHPVMGQCCTLGDLRRLAALAGMTTPVMLAEAPAVETFPGNGPVPKGETL